MALTEPSSLIALIDIKSTSPTIVKSSLADIEELIGVVWEYAKFPKDSACIAVDEKAKQAMLAASIVCRITFSR